MVKERRARRASSSTMLSLSMVASAYPYSR